jgi:hypothetical protein
LFESLSPTLEVVLGQGLAIGVEEAKLVDGLNNEAGREVLGH